MTQITICSIISKIVAPKLISNFVDDIKSITWNVKNIKFTYCNKTANSLVDRITKRGTY